MVNGTASGTVLQGFVCVLGSAGNALASCLVPFSTTYYRKIKPLELSSGYRTQLATTASSLAVHRAITSRSHSFSVEASKRFKLLRFVHSVSIRVEK